MATSITFTPECADTVPYTPAFNKLMFAVTSGNNFAPNFKYILQIYNVAAASNAATVRQFPRTDNGRGLLDLHQILSSYVTPTTPLVATTDTAFLSNTSALFRYRLDVGEEYGALPVTQYLAQAASSDYYAWPASIPYNDYVTFDADSYVLENNTKKLLTTKTTFTISEGQYAWLFMLTNVTNNAGYANVKTFDSNGTQLGEYKIPNSALTVGVTSANRYLRVPIGHGNMPTIGVTAFSGTTPIIQSNVASYKVHIRATTNAVTSAEYTYNVIDECRYDGRKLVFRNYLGGFDSVFFQKVSKGTMTANKDTYQKIYGSMSAGSWAYTLNERGHTTYFSQTKDKVKAVSDWLSDDDLIWLRQLVSSPEAYEQMTVNGAEALIPIRITTSTYDVKKSQNERAPILMEIEYEYAYAQNPIR